MIDPVSMASAFIYAHKADEYLEVWKDRRPKGYAKRFAAVAGQGAVVLNPACGPGLDIRLLRDAGLKAVSGDLSYPAMKVAHKHHPHGLVAVWNFKNLPFADNTFSGIWAPATLQHYKRHEYVPILREFQRVQKDGPIVLSLPEGDTDAAYIEDPPSSLKVPVSMVTASQMWLLLSRMGYKGIEVEVRPDPRGIDLRWVYGWGVAPTTKNYETL